MLKLLLLGFLMKTSTHASVPLETESAAAASIEDDEKKLRKIAAPLIRDDLKNIIKAQREIPEEERASIIRLITAPETRLIMDNRDFSCLPKPVMSRKIKKVPL
jgi:hypothetical protein